MGEIKVQITANKSQTLQVGTKNIKNPVQVEENPTHYYSTLAKEWAVKMSGLVQNEDYSSKYWADKSHSSADIAITNADIAINYSNQMDVNYNNYINEITNVKNETIQEVENFKKEIDEQLTPSIEQAKQDIENSRVDAIKDINLTKDNVIDLISSKENTAISNLNDAKLNAETDISTTGENVIVNIQTEKQEVINDIKAIGQNEYEKIVKTGIDTRSNLDLSNLTPEGERHFLGQRNISNCIKSAPTLVKWHLTDGTITLEAGSIVRWAAGKEAPTLNIGDLYNGYPIVDISWDGANLIYYTQTQQDYSWTFNAYTGYCQMFLQPVEGAEFWGLQTDQVKSGNTPPSSPGNVNYYNTENNTCLHLRDNIPQSFPLMKLWLQGSAGVATAIDVYDTGGCMGSSFWLNKNILINLIDGIDNECGLKSYEYTTTHDRFGYCPPDFTQYNANVWFGITKDSDTTAFNTSILANWNVQNNLQIISTNPNFSISSNPKGLVATNVVVVNGNILSYTPRMPFRIADAQDLDGRYIQASTTLVTSTNIVSNGTQTIDLSSLLPRDNHIYEVIINVAAQTDATVGHTVNFYLSSDITPSFCVFRGRTSVANMNVNCGGNVKIPVGPQRSIVLRNSGTGTAMNISATTSGYRQIH